MCINSGQISASRLPHPTWLVAASILTALVASPVLVVQYKAAEARGLVNVVASLRIGQSFNLTDPRLERYRSYQLMSTPYCKGNSAVSYQFISPWLHKLHLSPGNEVDVNVETHDGRLIHKSVLVLGEPRYGATLAQGQSDVCGSVFTSDSGHRDVLRRDNGPYFRNVKIHEDQTISAAQLDADWDIDLSCFASMHACSHPDQVLRSALASHTQ